MSSLMCLTLLLLWITECTALTLTSSTTLIGRNGTRDFYINCSTDDHPENQSQSEMVEIRSMRISKLESSRWHPVIEMDSDWKAPKVWGDLKSSFLIGAKGPTSLQVTWDLASNLTAGLYVCDLVGYMWNGQAALQRSSPLHVDVEIPLTLYELLEMIQSSNRKLSTALKNIDIHNENIKQIKVNETKLHNAMEDHEDNFEKIGTDIKMINESVNQNRFGASEHEKQFETLRTDTEMIKENLNQTREHVDVFTHLFYTWPHGPYALLMPETGCPANDGVVWKSGWRKHHTKSSKGQNYDKVSTPAHMKKPVMETYSSTGNNFMTQHHCSVIEQSTGREWPSGSYCIMRYRDLQCPIGFIAGRMIWDDEDTNNGNTRSGHHAVASISIDHSTGETNIFYCCRSDRSSSTPIFLPRAKPFYLYRFKGRCQRVYAMKVTPEFMLFDTFKDINFNKDKVNVPDGSKDITDVKLELCYYKQI